MDYYQPGLFDNKKTSFKPLSCDFKEPKSLEKSLEELKYLTEKKDLKAIKSVLINTGKTLKGDVFEHYLAYLYEGNGFEVSISGGKNDKGVDIKIYTPDDVKNPLFLIQAKNHKSPLDYDATRIELLKFEEKAKKVWNCNQFEIVSVSGFVFQAQELRRHNLNLRDWSYIEGLVNSYSPNCKEPYLRLHSHNQIAYEESLKLLEDNKRVCIVQATGTGKSYVIARIILHFYGKKVLFLSPSHHINRQFQSSFSYIASRVSFDTYQGVLADFKSQADLKSYDLIVLDEFHRVGAEKWGESLKHLIDSSSNPFIFGTSATPIRYLDQERDMSAEIFEKNVAVELSLSDAIVRNILPSPVYVSSLYTLKEECHNITQKVDDSELSDLEKKEFHKKLDDIAIDWEETKGVPQLLKKHISPHMRKFIIFCQDSTHLNDMTDAVSTWFRKANPSLIKREKYIIKSDFKDKDNKKTLERYTKSKGETDTVHLLFCINMLNEGLHIEGVDGVILLRETQSPIIHYQQIGRCLKAQSSGHQPIIFDLVNNFKSIKTTDFKEELKLAYIKENKIRASNGLKSKEEDVFIYDNTIEIQDVLAEMEKSIGTWNVRYKALLKYKDENGSCLVPTSYKDKELANWVSNQRKAYKKGELSKEKIKKLEDIGFSWDPIEENWNNMFKKISLYHTNNGNCLVPRSYKDKELHYWVKNQRTAYKKGELSKEKIKKLEDIGFSWDPIEENWNNMFKKISLYHTNNGNCLVPTSYKDKELSYWVTTQRIAYKNGKLSKEKNKKLKDIGFSWDPNEEHWNNMFKKISLYHTNNGNSLVPRSYKDKELANWVKNQRIAYKKGELSKEKIKKLEDIGFVWDPNEENWNNMFKKISLYHTNNGNCLVPQRYKDKELAIWVANQRKAYKKGELSKEKIKKLEDIGFSWDTLEENWNNMFKKISLYHTNNGNCLVPQRYKDKELAIWVANQRKAYKKGELSKEKIKKLEDIGFSWDTLEENWNNMFKKISLYHANNGNSLVPQRYKDKELAIWVANQRKAYKKGELSKEKIKKLEDIGFSWDPIEENWNNMFKKISLYHTNNGNCLVPTSYKDKELANWVSNQRNAYKNGKLSKEKIKKLEDIGFVWDLFEENWNNMFKKISLYHTNNGNCLVPTSYKDKELANWVSTQRQAYKKGELSKEKIKKLEDIGFSWDPIKENWNNMFKKISLYHAKNGNCLVPYNYKDKELAKWVTTQRSAYKNGKLSKEKIKKLKDIGFSWDQLEENWNNMFKKISFYHANNGNCLVPYNYKDKELARWVTTQRSAYKNGKLSKEKIKKLEDIGFVWSVKKSKKEKDN